MYGLALLSFDKGFYDLQAGTLTNSQPPTCDIAKADGPMEIGLI
jgi:hypothetical protein